MPGFSLYVSPDSSSHKRRISTLIWGIEESEVTANYDEVDTLAQGNCESSFRRPDGGPQTSSTGAPSYWSRPRKGLTI